MSCIWAADAIGTRLQDGGAAEPADGSAADADLLKSMLGSVRGRLFKKVPRLDDLDFGFDDDSGGATAA